MTNVVVGAGSGMGTAVAKVLAPRGHLIVADLHLDTVISVAEDIGGDVEALPCDITDTDQVDALLRRVGELGDLEAFVLSAGLSGSMAGGRRILEVNLISTARVMTAVEPLLRPGSVGICFASMSGYRVPQSPALLSVLDDPLAPDFFEKLEALGMDPDDRGAYPISKCGVHRLVRGLAPAYGARGARIMSVSPGINDTPMNRLDEENNPIMADFISAAPLGRRGKPEEVAKVVAFLTSEDASFMTGSDVLVDGGMVAVIPEDSTGGAVRG
jgi:NAD(P)-dependent dehydrogenase (short-subunit alcohol dehydrogenase family)